MKHIPILLFFSLLTNTLYSQPFGDAAQEYRVIRIEYENSGGSKETTNFKYDKTNRIKKALWTINDKSRYSTNYYEYDSSGNLVAAYRDFSDGITSFERFDYDESGNKISEYFYRSDSVSGNAKHTYNNNQLIQSEFFKHKGWLSGKLEFKYYDQKKKLKGFLLNGNDTLCTVHYNYDSIGNLIREFWDFNGKWSQTFNYVYKKIDLLSGSNNFRISKESYTFNNEQGGPSIYYYNEQNLLIHKVFSRSDSLKTNTFYDYDEERKLVASKRIYSDNSVDRFTYIYDENNNLILRNHYKADTLYGFESYLYDSDNVLKKAYLKNFDGWLSGTICFKSDELGKITTGKFLGENGFNASIDYGYDRDNLLSKIRWTFSYGKFQEYSFEYENIPSP